MFFELFVVLLVVLWIYLKRKRQHLEKLSEQLKINLRPLPFVGHSYLLAGNAEQRMTGFKKVGLATLDSGGTSSVWHSNNLYIVVADPKVAEIVTKNCLEKDDLMNIFRTVTGDGSVFASVAKWRPRRKLIAPTFNMNNLNRFVQVFAEQSRIMADNLKNMAGKGPCSMWHALSSYSADAVAATTLGINLNVQKNAEQPFMAAIEHLFNIAATFFCQPWLQFKPVLNRLPLYKSWLQNKALVYDFIDEIIQKKKKSKENGRQNQDNPASFLELLLDSDDGVDNLLIREECLVFLGAGTDTSAVGMGYCMLMLAKHPELQQKVYQELLEVMGDSDRRVQADDLHRFKYLDAFIKETLRLYPPIPVIARKVTTDVLLPSGVNLIPGCGVLVHIWAIHRNPEHWGPDAEHFRPERFLDSTLRHPAAFMPFSYGPRNCLGYQYAMMSMKSALATMVRRYRLAACSADPLRVKLEIMMRHVDNYPVTLEART